MPLEVRPGIVVPIPCRHCGKSMIRWTVSEGSHTVACPNCGSITDVKAYTEAGSLRVKSAKGAPRVKPGS